VKSVKGTAEVHRKNVYLDYRLKYLFGDKLFSNTRKQEENNNELGIVLFGQGNNYNSTLN